MAGMGGWVWSGENLAGSSSTAAFFFSFLFCWHLKGRFLALSSTGGSEREERGTGDFHLGEHDTIYAFNASFLYVPGFLLVCC
jgi:hypothetical protein